MQKPKPQWIIFIGLLIPYLYIFPRWVDWNQNTRFDLTAAMVERGTLSIDEYIHNTGDYALFDQHAYSDKAPGLSLAGVPIYFILKPLTHLDAIQSIVTQLGRSPAATTTINRPIDQIAPAEFVFATDVAIITWLTVALPTALLGIILLNFLGKIGYSPRARIISVLVYGLATPVFAYAATFYGHQPAAIMLFSAFAWLHIQRERSLRSWELFSIGALLGYAVVTEYPAVLIATIIFMYGLWIVHRFDRLIRIIVGGLLPIIVLGIYNAAIFGSPFTLAYQYVANPRLQSLVGTGFLSASLPTFEAIWGLTFSPYRGLFFAAPILLLSIVGLGLLARRSTRTAPRSGASVFRAEWFTSLCISILFLLLVSASAQWFGGYAAGPRYLVPMLPFLVWPLAAVIDRVEQDRSRRRMWLWLAIGVLIALSIVITWSLTVGGQYYTPDDVRNPLIEYSWPHIAAGDVARNVGMLFGLRGLGSLLPLISFVAIIFGVAWRSTQSRLEKTR